MSTDVTLPQKAILMKSGLVIFIETERATKLENILGGSEGHRFINLGERTINSAEIEGIYSPEEYGDIQRTKQGQYKCFYGHWHQKRETCDCEREYKEKVTQYRRMKARLDDPNEKFDDDFQKKAIQGRVDELHEWLSKRGLLPK